MKTGSQTLAVALAFCLTPAWSQAQGEISDHAVVLPPQMFDDSAKGPNTTRERSGEWSIYAGVYLMQPVFAANPAFVATSGGNLSRQVDFSANLDGAPQVWLGYVSERGWGVRGRWFQFDHDYAESLATGPGETVRVLSPLALGQPSLAGTVVASSTLAVNVMDFQASYSCESAKWSLLAAFGIRYTHMSQDYRATLGGAATRIDVVSGHNLNGAGPSFSLETKRRLGETGFAAYGNFHGAILFGKTNEIYTVLNNGVYQEFARSHTDAVPVSELEVGGEYARNMGRAKVYLQAGFIGQVWFNGGSASNIDPLGNTSAAHSNFGFLGVSLRAGLRY